MKNSFQNELQYNWEKDIQPYLDTIQDVEGGFSPATRGIITLKDDNKVFVKIAIDENTTQWLTKEIKSYEILNRTGYKYIPKLLSVKHSKDAMAIEYLENHLFIDRWDDDKLDAVLQAKKELNKYKTYFEGIKDFESDIRLKPGLLWGNILSGENIKIINRKLENLKCKLSFDKFKIKEYKKIHDGWKMIDDALIHEDIRYDNFGYNPETKSGKLVDWNWLCIGNESLDTTSLFISMLKSGYDPYVHHPEKYDRKMVVFLIEFWLNQILNGDENSSDREFKLRFHQAESLRICVELLESKA